MPKGENYTRWLNQKMEEGYGIYPLESSENGCYLSVTKPTGDGIPCYSRVVYYAVWHNDNLGYIGTDYLCGLKVYEQKLKYEHQAYKDISRMMKVCEKGSILRATSDNLNEG